ncbi:hypothetical protein Q8A67_020745 [Cirrhinus molitorella]|uniref:Uncharacterized protein n=1 Tax=Cirrhinus molitorella TaxID=172907 RepID=A0AA88TE97_9TELE|nr:hypothetical protein Q8A67_020745 [Cirrhinus molitorella]
MLRARLAQHKFTPHKTRFSLSAGSQQQAFTCLGRTLDITTAKAYSLPASAQPFTVPQGLGEAYPSDATSLLLDAVKASRPHTFPFRPTVGETQPSDATSLVLPLDTFQAQGQTPHLFPPPGKAYPFKALNPDLPSDTTSLGFPSDVGESSPGRVPSLVICKRGLSI